MQGSASTPLFCPKKHFLGKLGLLAFSIVCFLCLTPSTAITAERQALPPGFIAVSEAEMTWAEAKAFCQKQGGRLPRINKKYFWDGEYPPPASISIEGFGTPRTFVPSGLPRGIYWLETTRPDSPVLPSWMKDIAWLVVTEGAFIDLFYIEKRANSKAVCISLDYE